MSIIVWTQGRIVERQMIETMAKNIRTATDSVGNNRETWYPSGRNISRDYDDDRPPHITDSAQAVMPSLVK